MSDFEVLLADVNDLCFDAFGEKAIYAGGRLIDVIINKAVPYSDEEGQVFSTIDEMQTLEQDGLTIVPGNTIQTNDRTYKVQRFLRQEGKLKVYEIA